MQSDSDDGWDWPFMLFFGTVELRMEEDRFWKTTPRKFVALCDAFHEYNKMKYGDSSNDQAPKQGFIDQIPGW